MGEEVQLEEAMHSLWEAGKRIMVPVVERNEMVFVDWSPSTPTAPHRSLSFHQPPPSSPASVGAPCVVVCPGRAFTKDGGRLSWGGGYYDRVLASLPDHTHLIGVAFRCQVVSSLPL